MPASPDVVFYCYVHPLFWDKLYFKTSEDFLGDRIALAFDIDRHHPLLKIEKLRLSELMVCQMYCTLV